MAMTINTNIVSINSQRNLGLSGNSLSTTMQRLSSGLRVNSAKDDAAGLAIAERMNAQAKGLAVASRNANDGISLAQTAEGALGKMGDMLQRMRELAVQSSNATNSTQDREALQSEVNQLRAEIDRVAKTTTFNGQKILDGSFAGGVFQVGAGAGDNITVGNITNAKTSNLGSASYGVDGLTLKKDDMKDLAAIGSNVLSIKVGETSFGLGSIAKANSSEERAGQLVAAINAKTSDTGVTAYLNKSDAGVLQIDLRSSNVESVTEVDTAGKSTTSTKAVAVTLAGFELAQTGLASAELSDDLAPVAGNGYANYRLTLLQEMAGKKFGSATTATVDLLTPTSSYANAETALTNAVADLNTKNSNAYIAAPATPSFGVTNATFSRDAAGVIGVAGAAIDVTEMIALADALGVDTTGMLNGSAWATGHTDTSVKNNMVTAAKNMSADQVDNLTGDTKAFAEWARQSPPATYTKNDFTQPDKKDAPFVLANYSYSNLMDGVNLLVGGINTAEDVFGETNVEAWVDSGDWKTGLTADMAKAAFQAAQDFVTKKAALGITAGEVKNEVGMDKLDISTQAGAWVAMKTIDSAIDQVNTARADLGALQIRFEKAIENIDIQSENITAARGRIVDADFASETANLSRAQILQQAGTAMVAQANQLPQNVLSLLR